MTDKTDKVKPTQTTFGVVYIPDVHLTQSTTYSGRREKSLVKSESSEQHLGKVKSALDSFGSANWTGSERMRT